METRYQGFDLWNEHTVGYWHKENAIVQVRKVKG